MILQENALQENIMLWLECKRFARKKIPFHLFLFFHNLFIYFSLSCPLIGAPQNSDQKCSYFHAPIISELC